MYFIYLRIYKQSFSSLISFCLLSVLLVLFFFSFFFSFLLYEMYKYKGSLRAYSSCTFPKRNTSDYPSVRDLYSEQKRSDTSRYNNRIKNTIILHLNVLQLRSSLNYVRFRFTFRLRRESLSSLCIGLCFDRADFYMRYFSRHEQNCFSPFSRTGHELSEGKRR